MNRPTPQGPGKEPSTSIRRHRGWTIHHSGGSAQRFHDIDPAPDTDHRILIHRVTKPAVIFGSTQLAADHEVPEDTSELDIEVCRRRSGGGLVIARPEDVWIDAVVPRYSPLHRDDVGVAFVWLGQVWLDALRPLVVDARRDGRELRLAEPPPGRRAADRGFFCFADVGHGELLLGDRKIVGISQRRTRNWTRLQSLLITRWEPAENDSLVTDALTLIGHGGFDRAEFGGPPLRAAEVKAGLGADDRAFEIDRETIVDAVLRHLPPLTETRRPSRPEESSR